MNPQSQLWPRRVRAVPILTAMAVSGLLATACGGSPSSTGSGGSSDAGGASNSPSAVAYARCVRSHGVPNYPDPNSSGLLPKITPSNESQLGVSQSRFNAAQTACGHLWPYQAPTPGQHRLQLAAALKFARCMRSRSLPNFPDPTTGSDGIIEFVFRVRQDGFNPHSPQVLAKVRDCEHELPADMRLGGPDGIHARVLP